jgi:hypothetical protein
MTTIPDPIPADDCGCEDCIRRLADLWADALEAMRRRKSLLAAACCLSTTKTLRGAQTALAEWDGPPEIRDEATTILGTLTEDAVKPSRAQPIGSGSPAVRT